MKHIHASIPNRIIVLLMGMALLSLPASHAIAAEKDDKQARAAQRRMQQMQQIQQKLEQENASLKEQLKELESKLASAQSMLAKQKQNMGKLQAENSAQLSACQSAELAVRRELEMSEEQYKQLSGEKSRLETALSQQKDEAHACQEKNLKLINISRELMKKYEKEALSGVEPLTGLKGVEIENRFQDYRDQAESQYYRPRK